MPQEEPKVLAPTTKEPEDRFSKYNLQTPQTAPLKQEDPFSKYYLGYSSIMPQVGEVETAARRFARGVGRGLVHPVRAFLPESLKSRDEDLGIAGMLGEFVGAGATFVPLFKGADVALTGVGLLREVAPLGVKVTYLAPIGRTAAGLRGAQAAKGALAFAGFEAFAGETPGEAPRRAVRGLAEGLAFEAAFAGVAAGWRAAAPKWRARSTGVKPPTEVREPVVYIHPLRWKIENFINPSLRDTRDLTAAKIRAIGSPQEQLHEGIMTLMEEFAPGGHVVLPGLNKKEFTQLYKKVGEMENLEVWPFPRVAGEGSFDALIVDQGRVGWKAKLVSGKPPTQEEMLKIIEDEVAAGNLAEFVIKPPEWKHGGMYHVYGKPNYPEGVRLSINEAQLDVPLGGRRELLSVLILLHEFVHHINFMTAFKKGGLPESIFRSGTKEYMKAPLLEHIFPVTKDALEAAGLKATLTQARAELDEMTKRAMRFYFRESPSAVEIRHAKELDYYTKDIERLAWASEYMLLEPQQAVKDFPVASRVIYDMVRDHSPETAKMISRESGKLAEFLDELWRLQKGGDISIWRREAFGLTRGEIQQFRKTGWAPGFRAYHRGKEYEFARRLNTDEAIIKSLNTGLESTVKMADLQRPIITTVARRSEEVIRAIDGLLETRPKMLPGYLVDFLPVAPPESTAEEINAIANARGMRRMLVDTSEYAEVGPSLKSWIKALPNSIQERLIAEHGTLKLMELQEVDRRMRGDAGEFRQLLDEILDLTGHKGVIVDDEGFVRLYVKDQTTVAHSSILQSLEFNVKESGAVSYTYAHKAPETSPILDIFPEEVYTQALREAGVRETDIDYFREIAAKRYGERLNRLKEPKITEMEERVESLVAGESVSKEVTGDVSSLEALKGLQGVSVIEGVGKPLFSPTGIGGVGDHGVTIQIEPSMYHKLAVRRGGPDTSLERSQSLLRGDDSYHYLKAASESGKELGTPTLWVRVIDTYKGPALLVEGHEGRHRSLVALDEGDLTMPVQIIRKSGSEEGFKEALEAGRFIDQEKSYDLYGSDYVSGSSAQTIVRSLPSDDPIEGASRIGIEVNRLHDGRLELRDHSSKTVVAKVNNEDELAAYINDLGPDEGTPILGEFPGAGNHGGNVLPPDPQDPIFPHPMSGEGPENGERLGLVQRLVDFQTLFGSVATALENFSKAAERHGLGPAYSKVYIPAHKAMINVHRHISDVKRPGLGDRSFKEALQDLSHTLVRVPRKRNVTVTGHMEALSKEEIAKAGGLMVRAMNPGELRAAKFIESAGLENDVPRLMSTLRLIKGVEKNRLATVIASMERLELSPEAQEVLKLFKSMPKFKERGEIYDYLGLTKPERDVVKIIEDSIKAKKDDFSIYAVSRYASAPKLKKGFKNGQEQFAFENKMTKHELEASRLASEILEEGFRESGLDAKRHLSGYWPHMRMWVRQGWEPSEMNLPAEVLDWVHMRYRSGELNVYETDPLSTVYRHIRGLYMKREFDPVMPAINDALRGMERIDPRTYRVMNEFVHELQGKPHASFDKLQGALSRAWYVLTGKRPSDRMVNDLVSGLAALTSAAVIPFRPALIARNFFESLLKVSPRTGLDYYFKALTYVTSPETRKEAFQAAMKSGAIRPATQRLRSLHAAEEMFGPTAPSFVHKYLTIFDKGFEWYQSSDDWGRAIAHHAQRFRMMDNLDDFVRGKVDEATFMQRAKITTYDPLDAEIAMKAIRDGEYEKAANHLGEVLSRESMTRYGYADHPVGWNSVQGRLFGQFGTWPVQYKDYLLQGITRGTTKDKVEFAAIHGGVAGAIVGAGAAIGVNLKSWTGAGFYTGGPYADMLIDVVKSINGSETEKSLARANLYSQLPIYGWMTTGNPRSVLVPGSYLLGDLGSAYTALQDGEIFKALMEGSGVRTLRADQKPALEWLMRF